MEDVGLGPQEFEAELPLQSFLDNLHMKETKETAPEAKAQGGARLRLVDESAVVEVEPPKAGPERFVFFSIYGV